MNDNLKNNDNTRSTYNNRVSLFNMMKLNTENIVFLGDSLTQRNEWREFLTIDSIVNRGIDSDTVAGVLSRLNQILPFHVKKIFLMIGINDLSNDNDLKEVLNTYRDVLDEIKKKSPVTEVYVQSLLPVNHSIYSHHLDNKLIVKFNSKLYLLTNKVGYVYIDLYDDFKAEYKNELDMKFTNDGVHLSGEGYKIWKKNIESYI